MNKDYTYAPDVLARLDHLTNKIDFFSNYKGEAVDIFIGKMQNEVDVLKMVLESLQ